jgi:hypothetical protein
MCRCSCTRASLRYDVPPATANAAAPCLCFLPLHKLLVDCSVPVPQPTSSPKPKRGLCGVMGALLQLPKHSWSAPAKPPSLTCPPIARAEPGCPVKLLVRCTPAAMLLRLLPVRMGRPWKKGSAASVVLAEWWWRPAAPGQLPTRPSPLAAAAAAAAACSCKFDMGASSSVSRQSSCKQQ